METLPLKQIFRALEDVLKLYPRILLKIFGASFFSPRSYSVLQERIEDFSIVDMQLKPEVDLQNANLENGFHIPSNNFDGKNHFVFMK